MANNIKLKEIESNIIKSFCGICHCKNINISNEEKKLIFNKMMPDIVAYGNRVLYIGEITTSGYFGKNGRNFHIGATRKLAESFVKLYLYNREVENIVGEIKHRFGIKDLKGIEFHFVVPKGSKFINDLGYRGRLFNGDFVKLTRIPLSDSDLQTLKEVYDIARAEME